MAEFEHKLQAGQPISAYPEIAFAVSLARRIAKAVRPVYGIKQKDVPINEISHDFNYATDAYGDPSDNVRLWQFNPDGSWSLENQISLVAAATPTLHQKAMEKIEEGFRNLSRKYPKPDNGSHPRISANLWS